jgi:hypothetical protein
MTTPHGLSRRRLLAAAGSSLAVGAATAGCLGRDALGSGGDCVTETVTRPDDPAATVVSAGVRGSAAHVVLTPRRETVASVAAYEDDQRLSRASVDGETRLSWGVPDASFEHRYRVVLLDHNGAELGAFALRMRCDGRDGGRTASR